MEGQHRRLVHVSAAGGTILIELFASPSSARMLGLRQLVS